MVHLFDFHLQDMLAINWSTLLVKFKAIRNFKVTILLIKKENALFINSFYKEFINNFF